LLTKKEILKISQKIKKDGYALIPLEAFFVKGLVKIEIGLAKGKKLYDKREDMVKKDQKREMDRASKNKF
jgi:SsrA-binding protein